jgi:peroxiredoxin Q/BCP
MILGASFDTPEENKAFAEKFGYNFPLLCDTDRRIGLAYGACASPDAGYANRVTYVIGTDGRIEQTFPAVKPKNHPREILAVL